MQFRRSVSPVPLAEWPNDGQVSIIIGSQKLYRPYSNFGVNTLHIKLKNVKEIKQLFKHDFIWYKNDSFQHFSY